MSFRTVDFPIPPAEVSILTTTCKPCSVGRLEQKMLRHVHKHGMGFWKDPIMTSNKHWHQTHHPTPKANNQTKQSLTFKPVTVGDHSVSYPEVLRSRSSLASPPNRLMHFFREANSQLDQNKTSRPYNKYAYIHIHPI